MVPLRYPVYVAVGLSVAAYGVCYAVAARDYGTVVTVLPGGWLAAHGLLNGVLAAVREATDDEDEGSDAAADDGDGSGGDGDDEGDADDRPDVDPSDVELARRVPFQ